MTSRSPALARSPPDRPEGSPAAGAALRVAVAGGELRPFSARACLPSDEARRRFPVEERLTPVLPADPVVRMLGRAKDFDDGACPASAAQPVTLDRHLVADPGVPCVASRHHSSGAGAGYWSSSAEGSSSISTVVPAAGPWPLASPASSASAGPR